MELREGPGVLGAAVQAGRDAFRRQRPLKEVIDSLTRFLIHVGFGEQSGGALETGFVTFSVTIC